MITDMEMHSLIKYFENRGDVAFAFLFGSQARGRATAQSDVDIAVYFRPGKRRPVQFEEAIFYEGENRIWSEVTSILSKEVELLVLNRVASTVAASAIRGIPLAINDWGLYLDFMEVVTGEAEDVRELLYQDFLERMDFERRAEAKVA